MKKNWGVPGLKRTLKSIIKSWSSNKLIFVSSIAAVPVLGTVLVIVGFQSSQIVDSLSPVGNSSNSAGGNQKSESNSSGESDDDGVPSASSSPSASGTSKTSGGSPTRSATPSVETESQREAKQAALTYLNQSYPYFRPLFSRNIVIQMLRDDGFSLADATYGAGAISHNWSAEAELVANDYIANSKYSRSGMIAALIAASFTSSEANFAVSQLEQSYPDGFYWATLWLDQANSRLGEELNSGANFSQGEATAFLRTAGFTDSEVAAVVGDITEYSWQQFAELSALDYYYGTSPTPSREQVEDYLRGRGFAQSQIDYAMSRL